MSWAAFTVLAVALLLELDLRVNKPLVITRSRLARLVLRKNQRAFAFSRFVFLRYDYEESVVAHELAHVEQYRRLSIPLFLLLYVAYQIFYGYRENPLEREARARASLAGGRKA